MGDSCTVRRVLLVVRPAGSDVTIAGLDDRPMIRAILAVGGVIGSVVRPTAGPKVDRSTFATRTVFLYRVTLDFCIVDYHLLQAEKT